MKPDPALSLQPAAAQLDDKTNQSGQALTIHKRRSFKENISERLASERTNANSDVECFPVARHVATICSSEPTLPRHISWTAAAAAENMWQRGGEPALV